MLKRTNRQRKFWGRFTGHIDPQEIARVLEAVKENHGSMHLGSQPRLNQVRIVAAVHQIYGLFRDCKPMLMLFRWNNAGLTGTFAKKGGSQPSVKETTSAPANNDAAHNLDDPRFLPPVSALESPPEPTPPVARTKTTDGRDAAQSKAPPPCWQRNNAQQESRDVGVKRKSPPQSPPASSNNTNQVSSSEGVFIPKEKLDELVKVAKDADALQTLAQVVKDTLSPQNPAGAAPLQ